MSYFRSSFWVTAFGLILAGWVGYYYGGTHQAGMTAVFTALVLCILEISISFDNAVVNATVLKDMTPLWQKRFLTWGILIAVFGMRLIFPLAIVSIVASVNPWEALVLAASKPEEYAALMTSVHHEVAAFGGAFLMLVALKYFFDHEKEVHWIRVIEKPLSTMGRLEAIEVGICLLTLIVYSKYLEAAQQLPFLIAGACGILTYLAVEAIGTFLQTPEKGIVSAERASIGMFLYLEVLDASFSFDGVIGAFAITNNLFIIAIGLGVGAMFVRSLTILMVEKGTLEAFRYLEHGAFYAVGSLAFLMFTGAVVHVPEALTGLIGAGLIGLSIVSSLKHRRA